MTDGEAAPDPRAGRFELAASVVLAMLCGGASGLAFAVLRQAQRWPGAAPVEMLTPFSRGLVVGLAVAVAVLVVGGHRAGSRRAAAALRRLAAPFALPLLLSVLLIAPARGLGTAIAGLASIACGLAVVAAGRALRGAGEAPPPRALAARISGLAVALAAVAGAATVHEPAHVFRHPPGWTAPFSALRPAARVADAATGVVPRVLPAMARAVVDAPVGAAGFLFLRVALPASGARAVVTVTAADGVPLLRATLERAAGVIEPDLDYVPVPLTARLTLSFTGDSPYLVVKSFEHLSAHRRLSAEALSERADPPQYIVVPPGVAVSKVQADGETRNAVILPVPARACFAVRSPMAAGSSAIHLVDGYFTGEATVAVSVRGDDGATLDRWRYPVDRGRWVPVPIAVDERAASLCIATSGPADGGFRVAFAEPAHTPSPAAAESANIILVSIDTLRADALAVYGGDRTETAALDALAAAGTVFEAAVAPASWTLPSHASMFTGLYPSHHGMWGPPESLGGRRLPASATTVAEALRRRGYATAASTGSGYLSSRWGFARGFDRYFESDPRDTIGRKDLESVWRHTRTLLDELPEPFFLFVHTFTVHFPYGADPPPDGHGYRTDRVTATRLYLEGVTYVDELVARMRAHLRASGRAARTVLVVTSDHGEELGERTAGSLTQGHAHTVFEEVVHVPLIVAGPGVTAGRRVTPPVSLCDIAPTLLELAGAEPLPGIDGLSLAAVLAGGEAPADRVIVAERAREAPEWKAARRGNLKLIRDASSPAGPTSFYDLATDPGEVEPIGRHPGGDVLERVLAPLRATPPDSLPAVAIDPDVAEVLRALGYVE